MNVQQDLYLASLDTLALFCITVELSGRQDKLASLGTLVNRRHPSLLPSIWKSKQIYRQSLGKNIGHFSVKLPKISFVDLRSNSSPLIQ